jgi:Flp pilus assembly protein CpaB
VGICLLLAAYSAAGRATAEQHGAKPARTAPVVVAARTLPAGHLLARADLRTARWPADLRPGGFRAAPSAVTGRRLAGPVAGGEAITAYRLVGRDLAAGLPPSSVAAAVAVPDPHSVDLVRPGDRVDVLATRRSDDLLPGGAAEDAPADPAGESRAGRPPPVESVAANARVLAVFAGSPDGGAAEVVLAVSRATAVTLTRAISTHVFTVVLAPP